MKLVLAATSPLSLASTTLSYISMVWWHQLYQSVLTTVLHITLVIVNQDLYATCPSLRHPTTIQDHIKQSTALSPRHLQTSTGMLSGPFAFLCFILFIAALSFLLTNPLHFLIHQLTSVLSLSFFIDELLLPEHILFITFPSLS